MFNKICKYCGSVTKVLEDKDIYILPKPKPINPNAFYRLNTDNCKKIIIIER
jgi:hypothetical protein